MPWGTLTGIRPTKIVMDLLEKNMPLEEIKRNIKEVYMVCDKRMNIFKETAIK